MKLTMSKSALRRIGHSLIRAFRIDSSQWIVLGSTTNVSCDLSPKHVAVWPDFVKARFYWLQELVQIVTNDFPFVAQVTI